MVLSNIFSSRQTGTQNQGLGFAFVEMSVKAREEAAKFELNGSKWMGNQLQIYEVSSKNKLKQESQCLEFEF